MSIAMEDQCPPFKQQAWKELIFSGCVASVAAASNVAKFVFSRSVRIMAFNAAIMNTICMSTTVQIALHSCTISQTAFGSLTMSVGGSDRGLYQAGAVVETNLTATDSLVLGHTTALANPSTVYQVAVRYKET